MLNVVELVYEPPFERNFDGLVEREDEKAGGEGNPVQVGLFGGMHRANGTIYGRAVFLLSS